MKYHVKDLMVANPVVISADTTLKEATEKMMQIDCGVMPIGTPEKLVGMITDRDIALRAVAKGRNPATTTVGEIMTSKVFSVGEDDSLEHAAEIIKKQKVNRLIVKNAAGRLCGILSLSGLIRETADTEALAAFIHELARKNHRKAA